MNMFRDLLCFKASPLNGKILKVKGTELSWIPDFKCLITFFNKKVTVETCSGEAFMRGHRAGPLFVMDFTPQVIPHSPKKAYKIVRFQDENARVNRPEGKCMRAANLKELHFKLGHANTQRVKDVARLAGIKLEGSDSLDCVDCLKGKITRDSFKGNSLGTSRPLELIHSDVGFIDVESFEGHSCFSIFVDDYTKFVVAFVMSSKGQASDCFRKYATIAQAKFGTKISVLRVDDGKEYKAKEFLDFCANNGTTIETTDGYTPELNGVSERMMRTLTEMVRTNLLSSGLPTELWDEALFYLFIL